MWFKNLSLYKFVGRPISRDSLREAVRKMSWKPLSSHEEENRGFASPWGEGSDQFVHSVPEADRLMFRREVRKLQAPVVKAEVNRRLRALIESEEIEAVTKEIRKQVEKEVKTELLPKIYPQQKDCDLYIDYEAGIIAIDETSDKRSEEIVSLLRRMEEDLDIVPLMPNDDLPTTFRQWLVEESIPPQLGFDEHCKLWSEEEGSITYKTDFQEDERIKAYLSEPPFSVAEIGLVHEGLVSFKLSNLFVLKSIKLTEEMNEWMEENLDPDEDWASAMLSLMVDRNRALVSYLLENLGGDRTNAEDPAQTEEQEI